MTASFVQDNQSFSFKSGTVRGLHFQIPPKPQAKLIRVVRGRIYDVAVDLRIGSPTYGRWTATTLTAHHGEQIYPRDEHRGHPAASNLASAVDSTISQNSTVRCRRSATSAFESVASAPREDVSTPCAIVGECCSSVSGNRLAPHSLQNLLFEVLEVPQRAHVFDNSEPH